MLVALVCPYPLDIPGGNVTAVRRLVGMLRDQGHEVHTFLPEQLGASPAKFDVVHGFHLLRSGPAVLQWTQAHGVPAVLTLTGTDVNVDLMDPEQRSQVLSILAQVDGVIALHPKQLDAVRAETGMGLQAAVIIPQAIAIGQAPYRFRTLNGFRADQFVALLPAGLRRVKAPHLALEAQRLRQVDEPEWELALVGPILEDDYAGELLDRMEHFPHARWCGPMLPEHMGACYHEANVVLNTSESEGASNTILEAQWAGVPVLARDNDGNRALIQDGVNGLLFSTSSDLARQISRLQRDEALQETLIVGGQRSAQASPSPEQEVLAHLELYRRLV